MRADHRASTGELGPQRRVRARHVQVEGSDRDGREDSFDQLLAASPPVDTDAFSEIATGAGPGEVFGPHVRGWNFDGATVAPLPGVSFFAYQTLRYGVEPGASDVDSDGMEELLTAPGPGPTFGAQVRGWNVDGGAATSIGGINFVAFAALQYGGRVAGDDVDADGDGDIAASHGPGPALLAWCRGFDHDGTQVAPLPGFDVVAHPTLYGAALGLGQIGGSPAADLVVAPGPDPAATTELRAFDYTGTYLVPRAPWFEAFPGSSHGATAATAHLGL